VQRCPEESCGVTIYRYFRFSIPGQ
jgi:hypothetical protein